MLASSLCWRCGRRDPHISPLPPTALPVPIYAHTARSASLFSPRHFLDEYSDKNAHSDKQVWVQHMTQIQCPHKGMAENCRWWQLGSLGSRDFREKPVWTITQNQSQQAERGQVARPDVPQSLSLLAAATTGHR